MSERKPPAHLGAAGRAYWRTITRGFNLRDHHFPILLTACEALDRGAEARELVASEGMLLGDTDKLRRANPAVRIAQEAARAFLAAEAALGLDVKPPGETGRPPGRR